MSDLFTLLFLIAALTAIVSLIWTIYNLIKKKNKKVSLTTFLVSFILSIVLFVMIGLNILISRNSPVDTIISLGYIRGYDDNYIETTWEMNNTIYDALEFDEDTVVIVNNDGSTLGFFINKATDEEIYEVLNELDFPIDNHLEDFISNNEADGMYEKSYSDYLIQLSEHPGIYGEEFENELSVMFYEF